MLITLVPGGSTMPFLQSLSDPVAELLMFLQLLLLHTFPAAFSTLKSRENERVALQAC